MGAEEQLLVPEEGIRTKAQKLGQRSKGRTRRFKYELKEEHKHDTKHTAILPRFGALARGNARTSCMSDHIYESRAEGRRATKMLLELYV